MSELLDFTVYNLLKEFDPKNEGFLPRSRFYKAIYLLHSRLKKRKIDISLPWCWYKFGPEIQEQYISKDVFRISATGPDADERYRLYYGKEPRAKGIQDKDKQAILNEIRKLNKEHWSTDKLIDEVYKKAPYKMLKTFKDLEDYLKKELRPRNGLTPKGIETIMAYLDDIHQNYRKEEFLEIFDEYLRIDDLVRITLEHLHERLDDLIPLLIRFREMIATKASILFNENLPDDWVNERETLLNERISAFRPDLDLFEKETFKEYSKCVPGDNRYSKMLLEVSYDMSKEA